MKVSASLFIKQLLLISSIFSLASCSTQVTPTKPVDDDKPQEEEKKEEEEQKEEEKEIKYQDLKFLGFNDSKSKIEDGVRYICLTFDKAISSDTDLVELEKTVIGNYIKIGNKFISDISGASVSCQKGSFDLLISVPKRITISEKTLLKITDGCVIGTSKLPYVRLIYENNTWGDYKYLYVNTEKTLKIAKDNTYSIVAKNLISAGAENSLTDKTFKCGTYFVRKSSFDASGVSSINDYFKRNAPSKVTYVDVPFNSTPKTVGSEYVYESSITVDKAEYGTDYIPVGYLKYDNVTMYGQGGAYYSSLIKEASKEPEKYKELFPEYCEFGVKTSSSTELVKKDDKYNLRFANTVTMTEGYDFSVFTYTCGTILVDKVKYEHSGCETIEEYILKNDSDLIKQDSTKELTNVNDVIQFTSLVNIPKGSYNTVFIPVGYLFINNKKYYSQNESYSCSLFDEAKKSMRDYPDLFLDHYNISLETVETPTISKKSNVYSLNFETNISVNEDGDLNSINYESGTILVNKSHFNNTGLQSFEQYFNNYEASTSSTISTYKKITKSENLIKEDDKYNLSTGFEIVSANYKTEFIPVGYLKINDQYIYSQSPTDYKYASLYGEASKTPKEYPEICTEYFALSLKTTDVTYELVDVSLNDELVTLSEDKNGFYKLVANANVSSFYLDGKLVNNTTFAKDSVTYLSVANGQIKYNDNSHGTYLGFAEPNREIWRDANSNPNLNSTTNNAIVFSEMKGECARIWISPATLYYGSKGAHPIFYNTGFSDVIHQEVVDEINNTIKAYRNAGIKDIIILVNGMYYSNDDYMVIHKDNDPTTDIVIDGHVQYNEIKKIQNNASLTTEQKNALIAEFKMCQVFPTINYDVFLENNKKFYTMLANLLDADYFECTNEINLEPFKFDIGYYEAEYTPIYNPNGQQITSIPLEDQYVIRDRVEKNVVDFCKTMTDGVLASNRKNIRVLTPALAGVNDSPRDDSWAKPTLRSVNNFFNGMYDYITNEKNDNPSKYFQGLNVHPYLFHSYDTPYNDCYLFWDSTKKNSDIKDSNFNTNFADDWVNYMNSIHNISVTYSDKFAPIFATEFGFTDYADSTSTKWAGYTDAKYLPIVINQIIPRAKTLSYLAGIYWFRLYSFDKGTTDGGEANFGFISKYQTIKNWGKDLYKQYTGETSTTHFEEVIANLDNTIPEGYYE